MPDHDDTGCVSSAPVSPFHFALGLRSFGAAIATVYRSLVLADVDPCRLVLLLDALNELHSWQVLRRSGGVPASGYQTKRPLCQTASKRNGPQSVHQWHFPSFNKSVLSLLRRLAT